MCVDPAVGKEIYDYYNGALGKEQTQRFIEHLFVCHKCQERVARLDWIFDSLRRVPNPTELFGRNPSARPAGSAAAG